MIKIYFIHLHIEILKYRRDHLRDGVSLNDYKKFLTEKRGPADKC